MRSLTERKLNKWILSLVMICLMVGSGVMDVFAGSYDDPVSVTIPYTHVYKADRNRNNDTFKYSITPLDGAPAPVGTNGTYTFSVDGNPGRTVNGELELNFKFDRPGEYLYKVASADRARRGFNYESRTYTVHVYVTNDGDGGLTANVTTVGKSDNDKYQRIELNPSHDKETIARRAARPTTTPRGDGTVPAAINGDGEPVEDEPTPTENIVNKIVPKGLPERDEWALLNLIASILTVIASGILVFRYFERIDTEEDEYYIRRKGNLRLAGLVPAIVSVAVFLLTEDLTLPMELADEWTLLMFGILAIDLLLAFIAHKKYEDRDAEAEAA